MDKIKRNRLQWKPNLEKCVITMNMVEKGEDLEGNEEEKKEMEEKFSLIFSSIVSSHMWELDLEDSLVNFKILNVPSILNTVTGTRRTEKEKLKTEVIMRAFFWTIWCNRNNICFQDYVNKRKNYTPTPENVETRRDRETISIYAKYNQSSKVNEEIDKKNSNK
ncbi:hypothetical protein LXL04_037039 [Taraxacum kok-saghyz]